MTRLVRWRYVLPRVVLLVALLLAVQYALGCFVRSSIIDVGEAAVGAKVELGAARVSLAKARVVLHDLRVADPHEPMQNLVQVDRCELDFDAGALLQKQAVVEHGEVVGVRLGTSRETTGALTSAPEAAPSPVMAWLDDGAADLARDWLDHLDRQFQRDLVSQFESVRLADELVARWPQQVAELEGRVQQLKRQAAELEAEFRDAQANPLRHVEFLKHLPKHVAALQKEFDQLALEVEKLPDVVETDRRAIIAARRHDEQLLRDELRIDPIDGGVLTAYLLRDEVAGPAGELVRWLRWARQVMPAEASPPQRDSRRGEDLVLAGMRRAPDLWIRSLALRGAADIGGQPLEWTGTITDLTSDPVLVGRPVRLRVTASGALPLELAAAVDRTQAAARDELAFYCESIPLPGMRLGQADKLQLSLGPSVAAMSIRVVVDGERLSGNVRLLQKQVHVTPSVGGELDRLDLAGALDQSLRHVDSVAVELSLAGTLDQPRWTLQSDLGPVVSKVMGGALERAAGLHARELLARSQRHVDEQLARLDRQISDEQSVLLPQVAGSSRLLEHIAQRQQPAQRLVPEELGRRLPAGSLFR